MHTPTKFLIGFGGQKKIIQKTEINISLYIKKKYIRNEEISGG